MRRIIVADDNHEVAEVFRRLLLRRAYDVDGLTAKNFWMSSERNQTEGVIVDLEMPVKDGWGAIEELRTTYP